MIYGMILYFYSLKRKKNSKPLIPVGPTNNKRLEFLEMFRDMIEKSEERK